MEKNEIIFLIILLILFSWAWIPGIMYFFSIVMITLCTLLSSLIHLILLPVVLLKRKISKK